MSKAPWEPIFGPMADDDRFTHHIREVALEWAANIQREHPANVLREETYGTFDGTYPHPGPDKVAGYKNPPPPGGSQ